MSSPGSLIATIVAALSFPLVRHDATAQQPAAHLTIPIEYYKLPNGMKVVLSRDTTTPTAIVAVYYNIGFRVEPKNRTGFAHLFEHLMFQGSANLEKLALPQPDWVVDAVKKIV